MDSQNKKNKKRLKIIIPAAAVLALAAAFFIFTSSYYRAEAQALEAMRSDETVGITRTDYGWLFDGPGSESALIFYPGARVEESAYAPLLRELAEDGLDVCLVKMPLRFAVLSPYKADEVFKEHSYEHWYIGGHSMGGAFAAYYAASNSDKLDGVILLASYPAKELDDSLSAAVIRGSEDTVIEMDDYAKGLGYLPEGYEEYIIQGGNHAQFGCYGAQSGDGAALIPPERQREEAADIILAAAGVERE